MMKKRPEVPAGILRRLGAICLKFPDVREEMAWVGRRWRIREDTAAFRDPPLFNPVRCPDIAGLSSDEVTN